MTPVYPRMVRESAPIEFHKLTAMYPEKKRTPWACTSCDWATEASLAASEVTESFRAAHLDLIAKPDQPNPWSLHRLADPRPGADHWACTDCDWAANRDFYNTGTKALEAFRAYHQKKAREETLLAGGSVELQFPDDPVNHPAHYTAHPSGVECITVTEWMGFNLGNAVKYIWRADEKGDALQDLEKAKWYLERELQRRKKAQNP